MRYFNTLRSHREGRALRQWDVAVQARITLDRYGRLEKGIAEPSYDEAKRLAPVFGVEPDALFPVAAATATDSASTAA